MRSIQCDLCLAAENLQQPVSSKLRFSAIFHDVIPFFRLPHYMHQ